MPHLAPSLRTASGLLAAAACTFSVSFATPAQAAPAATSSCQATGTSLKWGVKETWRSYISGSAQGDWTPSGGATYSTPNFIWPSGGGNLTSTDHSGSVAFPGSVRFTGHEGQLDTTMSNPTVVLSGSSAYLNLGFKSSVMEDSAGGDSTIRDFGTVHFVDIDMSKATTTKKGDQTVISVSNAPTRITATAAQDFSGVYPAGAAFDPISFQISVPTSCDAKTPGTGTTPPNGTKPTTSPTHGTTPTGRYPTGTAKPNGSATKNAPDAAAAAGAGAGAAAGHGKSGKGSDGKGSGGNVNGAEEPAAPTGKNTTSATTPPPSSTSSSSSSKPTSSAPSSPSSSTSPSSSDDPTAAVASPKAGAPKKNNHTTAIVVAAGVGLCAALGVGAAAARRKNNA